MQCYAIYMHTIYILTYIILYSISNPYYTNITGKVGVVKPPFQLPEFIAETGIAKVR